MFNFFSDLLMIRRFVLSAKSWSLQCFIATCRSLVYSRKSKGPKTDPCNTPHVILKVLDAKPLTDTNCLQFAKIIQTICLLIHAFHSDTICSIECYDPQYQKPSVGQQKYHKQSYHHQGLSLLLQSDLTEHTKLNNATESRTEGNM